MLGNGSNRINVEDEICGIISATENIERVLQTLLNTNDAQCTLFIGLELLVKTYLSSTKTGINNSMQR